MSAVATLRGLVEPGWADALAPVADDVLRLLAFARTETEAGRPCLPEAPRILRAFQTPFEAVRVLIVGQDPYPTPGHAVGLAFSTEASVRPLPRSLQNIARELHDDVGAGLSNGDLSGWAERGVLLLNRVLTVRAGSPGSHRGRGWEAVTACAIRALAGRDAPLVAILWGRDAATVRPLLAERAIIESAHPSPLSARRGFVGSRPFSRANALLEAAGAEPIAWDLTSPHDAA
jgi:uracil-DNA glycosylase